MSEESDDDRTFDEPDDDEILDDIEDIDSDRLSALKGGFNARRVLEQLREEKELQRIIRDNFDD